MVLERVVDALSPMLAGGGVMMPVRTRLHSGTRMKAGLPTALTPLKLALWQAGHRFRQAPLARPITFVLAGYLCRQSGRGRRRQDADGAGGSCILCADKQLARNPCFLTRGYGGQAARSAWLVDRAVHDAGAVGDEALLLAEAGPVIISANRAAGARLAEKSGYDLIVMDDGSAEPGPRQNVASACHRRHVRLRKRTDDSGGAAARTVAPGALPVRTPLSLSAWMRIILPPACRRNPCCARRLDGFRPGWAPPMRTVRCRLRRHRPSGEISRGGRDRSASHHCGLAFLTPIIMSSRAAISRRLARSSARMNAPLLDHGQRRGTPARRFHGRRTAFTSCPSC